MNLNEMRTLRVVAQTKSLAAAAAELHISAAAVHKQLKQLEADLGVELYERVGRSIRLTAACDLLLPYEEAALAQVEAGRQMIEEWKGLRQGVVRLGTGPTLGIHWVPRAIQRYRRRHPDIHITAETGTGPELVEQLRRGSLDLAMVIEDESPLPPTFESLVGWSAELVLVTGEARLRHSRRLAELTKAPFVGSRRGTRLNGIAERYFLMHGVVPDTVMRFESADAARAMLLTGFGWSLLPVWVVENDVRVGALWRLRPRERVPRMEIELLRSRELPMSPAVREFVAVAKATPLWRKAS
jgi:LysR family transcriptional activator of glutamate synthase operon